MTKRYEFEIDVVAPEGYNPLDDIQLEVIVEEKEKTQLVVETFPQGGMIITEGENAGFMINVRGVEEIQFKEEVHVRVMVASSRTYLYNGKANVASEGKFCQLLVPRLRTLPAKDAPYNLVIEVVGNPNEHINPPRTNYSVTVKQKELQVATVEIKNDNIDIVDGEKTEVVVKVTDAQDKGIHKAEVFITFDDPTIQTIAVKTNRAGTATSGVLQLPHAENPYTYTVEVDLPKQYAQAQEVGGAILVRPNTGSMRFVNYPSGILEVPTQKEYNVQWEYTGPEPHEFILGFSSKGQMPEHLHEIPTTKSNVVRNYIWKIPQVDSSTCYLYLFARDKNKKELADAIWVGPFAITFTSSMKLKVTSPREGDILPSAGNERTRTHEIKWFFEEELGRDVDIDFLANVRISYQLEGQEEVVLRESLQSQAAGKIIWKLPEVETDTGCYLRIFAPSLSDLKSIYCTIKGNGSVEREVGEELGEVEGIIGDGLPVPQRSHLLRSRAKARSLNIAQFATFIAYDPDSDKLQRRRQYAQKIPVTLEKLDNITAFLNKINYQARDPEGYRTFMETMKQLRELRGALTLLSRDDDMDKIIAQTQVGLEECKSNEEYVTLFRNRFGKNLRRINWATFYRDPKYIDFVFNTEDVHESKAMIRLEKFFDRYYDLVVKGTFLLRKLKKIVGQLKKNLDLPRDLAA